MKIQILDYQTHVWNHQEEKLFAIQKKWGLTMSLDWNKTNELFVPILPPTQKIDLIYDDPHKLSFTVSHAQTETNTTLSKILL